MLVALILFAAIFTALPPLHEVDFAQHLANGEWIAHHGIPSLEPFAWTREHQPFYAYSWLPELIYYKLLFYIGPLGLHIFEGLIGAAAVTAAYYAARRLALSKHHALMMSALNLICMWGVANTIRPQQILFVTVPLVWGIAASIRENGPTAKRLLAIGAAACISANSHLFFPVTLAPIVYFAASDRNAKKWWPAALAIVIAWFVSPHAFTWPQVFKLYFAPNIMTGRPPAIAEFVPGFEYMRHRPGVIITALALLTLPWTLRLTAPTPDRLTAALYWTAGLLMFAFAGRLMMLWWFLAIPLAASSVQRLTAASPDRLTAQSLTVITAIALLITLPPLDTRFYKYEGTTTERILPRAGEDSKLWLAMWLRCNTDPNASGKIFNELNYGSEFTWMLPNYSVSVDARNIFADSVAVDFALRPYGMQHTHASTWTRADVAILGNSFWLVPTINQHPEWMLLAFTDVGANERSGLWAKKVWWQQNGRAQTLPVRDIKVGDARASCDSPRARRAPQPRS